MQQKMWMFFVPTWVEGKTNLIGAGYRQPLSSWQTEASRMTVVQFLLLASSRKSVVKVVFSCWDTFIESKYRSKPSWKCLQELLMVSHGWDWISSLFRIRYWCNSCKSLTVNLIGIIWHFSRTIHRWDFTNTQNPRIEYVLSLSCVSTNLFLPLWFLYQ